MLNAKKFSAIYEDYLASGLTVRDYCSNQEMNEAKFYYWKNKLKGILPSQKGFVPVVFENNQSLVAKTSDIPQSQSSTNDQCALCEINYPNGVSLKLNKLPELDILQSLLLLNPGQNV